MTRQHRLELAILTIGVIAGLGTVLLLDARRAPSQEGSAALVGAPLAGAMCANRATEAIGSAKASAP